MRVSLLAQSLADEVAPSGTGCWSQIQPMLGVLAAAFVVSLLLTPVMRRAALWAGIIDWPDAKRKAHAKPVAYLGGLAIFAGWLAGVAFFIVALAPEVFTVPRGVEPGRSGFPLSIVVGAFAIVLIGLLDDVYGISARVKVGGQFFAAAAISSENVGMHLTQETFELIGMAAFLPDQAAYWLGTAVIAGLIVGGCNAMNLIDGLDGLASGVAGIAGIGIAVCAAIFIVSAPYPDALARGVIPMVICLALLGSVLGFLPYNFNPASIFMGDTGSLLLGYLCVAAVLMLGDTRGWAPMLFVAGLMCVALPITDTALSIIRRKLQGRPIFAPDAMHIHHMLRRSGLSVRQAVLAMYAMGAAFTGLGVATVALKLPWRVAFGSLAVLMGLIIVVGCRTARRLMADEHTAAAPLEAPAPGEEHGGKADLAEEKPAASPTR